MKIILFLLTIAILSGCKEDQKTSQTPQTPQTQQVTPPKQKVITVDSSAVNKAPTGHAVPVSIPNSKIEWKIKDGNKEHFGTVNWGRGEMYVDNGKYTGSNLLIDMNTVKIEDIKNEKENAEMLKDLSSEKYFFTEQNPILRIYINSVTPLPDSTGNYMLKGILMVKRIKKDISFPARVEVNNEKVTITADFNLDRTLWDLNVPGKQLSNEINLKIKLVTQ